MSILLDDIKEYWTNRAVGYSKVNNEELSGVQKDKWIKEIQEKIGALGSKDINILDVGCGPGFFSIILAELGYKVTAIDYTEAMIEKAKENAKRFAVNIKFLKMDAQDLLFDDEIFDVIVSRNLTWNLEKPHKAYKEWLRVLKKNGILLNFDANWYHHLFDAKKREEYENDRKMASLKKVEDHYTCTDVKTMEGIAKKIPLSQIMRPKWDISILNELGATEVEIDYEVWQRVWSEVEKINYSSTPMFLVQAIK